MASKQKIVLKKPIRDLIAYLGGIDKLTIDYLMTMEDPEGIDAIMVSENLDSDQNLPEHEVALLKHVRFTIVAVSPTRLMCAPAEERRVELWNEVRKKVAETLGGRWQTDDIAAAYNLAMVWDDKTISELVYTHQSSINPSIAIVRLTFINPSMESWASGWMDGWVWLSMG